MTRLYSDLEVLQIQRDKYQELCAAQAETIKALRYQVLILQRFSEEIEKQIDPEIMFEVRDYLQSKYQEEGEATEKRYGISHGKYRVDFE
jgi:hypothetical protein